MSTQRRRDAELNKKDTLRVFLPSPRLCVGVYPLRASKSTSSESGFALLLVFLMASLIAISLYMEMPRVAFQAERQKEQLLMERGM
jgi:hypothetical protein